MLFVSTKACLKLPPSTKVIGFRIQFCYHAIVRLNYRKPGAGHFRAAAAGLLNCSSKVRYGSPGAALLLRQTGGAL